MQHKFKDIISVIIVMVITYGAYAEELSPEFELSVSYKVPPSFNLLKPGAVKPEGWLKEWSRSAADGITGDLDERTAVFKHGYKGYHFEAQGVKPQGTGWPLEQCAYWLDGLVRLAYILDDETLILCWKPMR